MSNTKHTPGPWNWEEGTPTVTRKWNGMDVCVAQVKGADLHWHENGRMASIEAGANARLIAAAPELLDALKKLEHTTSFWKDMGVNISFDDIKQAREAIAKATQP